MKSGRYRFILCAVVLAIALVLFLVEEHLRGRWQLAGWKNRMAAQGEKFDIDACVPPPPAAANNGYPELTAACARLSGGWISQSAPPAWRVVAPGRAVVSRTLTQWVRNANDARSRTNIGWTELEQDLALYAEPMADARAALRKPVLDARLPYRLGFEILVPHLARFKGLAQCLAAQTACDLHHGRLAEAVEDLEAMLALVQGMRDERLIISQLVRHAIANIALGATWQALQAPGWNDAQLARLQKAWQSAEFIDPMLHALEMERAIGVVSYARLRESGAAAAALFGLSQGQPAGGTASTNATQSVDDLVQYFDEHHEEMLFRNLFLPVWRFAWSRQDELYYLRLTQTLLDAGRAAARERTGLPAVAVEKQLDQGLERVSAAGRVRRVVSFALLPGLPRAAAKAVLIEAEKELVIAAVALQRYHLRHGHPARELAALVPDFLPEPPRDYFAGQPLRYRLTDERVPLLYSVGRDGKDDGGDPKPAQPGSRSYFFQNGRDLVWPQPATAAEVAAFEATEKKRR